MAAAVLIQIGAIREPSAAVTASATPGMRITSATMVAAALRRDRKAPAFVDIDSIGGSVAEADRIAGELAEHRGTVVATVRGRCMSAANLVLVAAQLRVADRGARFLLHEAAYERVTEQERYDAVRLRHMATAAALASSKMADTLAEHCVAPRSLIRAQMDKAREFGALTACWLGLTHFIAGGMDGLPVPRLRARA